MRILLLSFVLCLSACCEVKEGPQPVPGHSKKVVVKLMDSLGMVALYIPERYDTAFVWEDDSDCNSCHHMNCRFQMKRNRAFEDGDYHFLGKPMDSVDQVTISYQPYLYDMHDGDSAWVREVNKWFREKLAAQGTPNADILMDTCFTVHDRLFSLVGTRADILRLNRTCYEIAAVTTVRGKGISFKFEMIQEKEDSVVKSLVPNAIDIIKTIRFSTPV